MCDTMGNEKLLLIELSDKSPQPDSSSAGRLTCSLSFVLLCHLRSIFVKLDTFRHSLCFAFEPLRFPRKVFTCSSRNISLDNSKSKRMCLKIFNFTLPPRLPQIRAATCGNRGKRANTGKRENQEKTRSHDRKWLRKGKILGADFHLQSRLKMKIKTCGN